MSEKGEEMLEELKTLIRSPKLWVTMVGVALIPALYNLSFLGSMWDPYGNVDNLPVAVVNQDHPSNFNNQTLAIGDNMVDNMSKKAALDYHFVSEEKAQKGLKDGDYYMIITLPKDLSEKATTLLTDKPEKLTINYQTATGRSVVASKMSDSAMVKLKETVSENITRTYTKAIFSSMSSLQGGLQTASTGGEALLNASQTIESGSKAITNNLATLNTGSQTLADGSSKLSSGLTTYTAGVSQLTSGIGTMSSGLTSYTTGVSQLANGSNTVSTGLSQYTTGVEALYAGLSQLNSQSQKLVDGVSNLQSSASSTTQSLINGATSLNIGLQTLSTSLNSTDIDSLISAVNGLNTLSANLGTLASSITTINTADTQDVHSTVAYQSLSADQKTEIDNALAHGSGAGATNTILSQIAAMQSQLSNLTQLANQLSLLAENVTNLQTGLATATTGSQNLVTGLSQFQTALTNESGLPKLLSGVTDYTNIVSQLTDGTSQLVSKDGQLTSGVAAIASGSSQLASKNSEISEGITKIQNGASTLDSKSNQLTSGASQLNSGTQSLVSGSGQLADGSSTLTNGLTTLSSGLTTLAGSLSGANQQLSLVSVTNHNADMVSTPVTTQHTDNDNVATNGIGMAPYMIAVSLMVVALSTNVIFAKSLSGRPAKNRFGWAKQKLLVNGLIATVGPIILYVAIQFLGFEANYGWRTLLFIILSSWTLMALVTALVGWDDRYGSFLSLVMLLLQVGSAGGSYPIELSGKFFQMLHPYLPMTYIVSGLRQTISMTGSIGKEVGILLAFLVGFMVLALLIYRSKAGDKLQADSLTRSAN